MAGPGDIPGVVSASGILGATDIPNYQELLRRRAIANALATRQRKFPTTLGEGMTYLGESIGDAMREGRLSEMEKAQIASGASIRNDPRSTGGTAAATEAAPPVAAAPAATPPPVAAAAGGENTFQGTPYTPAPVAPVADTDRRAPARLPAGLATDPNPIGAGADASDPIAQRERIARLLNPPPEVAGMVDPTAGAAQPPRGSRLASLSPLGTLSDAPPIGGPGSMLALSKIAPAYAPVEPPTGLTGRPAVPDENPPTPTTIAPMVRTEVAQAPPGMIPGSLAGLPGTPTGPAVAPPPAAPGAAGGMFPPNTVRPTPPTPVYPDPGAEPTPPKETKSMVFNRNMAADPRVDPTTQAEMSRRYTVEKEAQDAAFARQYNLWKERKVKSEESSYTSTSRGQAMEHQNLANQLVIRQLEGEGARALTPEEAARFYPGAKLPPGQAIWINRAGEPKFGPAPSQTNVNIDTKMETEYGKTVGKAAGEAEGELRAGARKAGGQLISLARAEALLNQIDTGALEPTKVTFGQFARALGIPDETLTKFGFKPEQFGSQQAFNGIINDLTIGRLGSGGFPSAQFSNTDLKFLQATVPSLGDDPQSNRIKIEAARMVARRDLEKAQEFAAWKRNPENKDKTFFAFEDEFNARVASKDITGDLQRQADDLLARTRVKNPLPSPAATPADLPPDERARGLKWLELNPNSPDTPAMKRLLGIP